MDGVGAEYDRKFSPLPSDWIAWEPDIIDNISRLPSDWILWELDMIEKFSHLPSDWIGSEPDIIEKFSHLSSDWIAWELRVGAGYNRKVQSPPLGLVPIR